MSIELYGTKTGNCIRAAVALEVAGIPYAVRHVDLAQGEQGKPPFLALNPAGKVPVLVDTSRQPSPLILTQSNAIVLYAADAAPERLLPPAERATVIERYFYFITDVIAPSHAAFYLRRRNAPEAAALLEERVLAAARAAERFAAEARFIGGDAFSVADIAAFTFLASVRSDLRWEDLPNLDRWYNVVATMPAVVKGSRAFDIPMSGV